MSFFFFFNDTATTEIYTLSLHDALPISFQLALRPRSSLTRLNRARRFFAGLGGGVLSPAQNDAGFPCKLPPADNSCLTLDRKSTRLNSSHANISYAVFCLKKKKISPGRR